MITLVLYSINVILRSGWSNNVVAISPLSPWCSSMTECESFWWIHEQLWPWQVQIIFGLLTFPKPKPWFSFSIWNPLPIKTFFLAMQSWGQMAGLSRSSESQTSSGQVRESLEQVEYVKLLVLNNKNWNWNSWSLKLVYFSGIHWQVSKTPDFLPHEFSHSSLMLYSAQLKLRPRHFLLEGPSKATFKIMRTPGVSVWKTIRSSLLPLFSSFRCIFRMVAGLSKYKIVWSGVNSKALEIGLKAEPTFGGHFNLSDLPRNIFVSKTRAYLDEVRGTLTLKKLSPRGTSIFSSSTKVRLTLM